MIVPSKLISKKNIFKVFLATSLLSSCFYLEAITTKTSALAQSLLEFRWNNDGTYKKLTFLQTARERLERSTYYLFLKRNDRKSAILKLSLKFPKHFKASLKEKNITLCKVLIGGYTTRTRCLEDIPSAIEISEDQKTIEIFPNQPIPSDQKSYAVRLKMFNPRKAGMYQVNAFSQSSGDLPVSLYLGSYLIEIDQ